MRPESQVECEALLSHLTPCVPLSCLSPVFAANLKLDIFHNLRLGRHNNTTKQAATAKLLVAARHFWLLLSHSWICPLVLCNES